MSLLLQQVRVHVVVFQLLQVLERLAVIQSFLWGVPVARGLLDGGLDHVHEGIVRELELLVLGGRQNALGPEDIRPLYSCSHEFL